MATIQPKQHSQVESDMVSSFSSATRSSPTNDAGFLRVRYFARMRLIFAVYIGLITGMTLTIGAQESVQRQRPGITLFLPQSVASEAVQINYFMSGSFGGYGSYVTAEKGRVSYDIPASVDGKPAGAVKIVAYLPGCEIVKLEITMQAKQEVRTLPCEPLGRVSMHGRILPIAVAQTPGIELEIRYEADWDHEFFGIADGMVTTIHVATVTPDEDGRFEAEVPDFFKQSGLGQGSFQFTLRNTVNRNIVAMLRPTNMPRFFGGLAIRPSYTPFVELSADTSISTPP
jgi:hypothetical protein